MLLLPLLASSAALLPAGARPELAHLPLHGEIEGCRSCGHRFVASRLSSRPHVFHLRQFLSPDESSTLIRSARENGLHPAVTSGNTRARRACDLSLLSPSRQPLVAELQREVARLMLSDEALQLPGGGCEDLHVLRYQPGGEYLPHYDAASVPRVLTVLYYLNGVGATWFPLSGANISFSTREESVAYVQGLNPQRDGLCFEPSAAGDALAFFNFVEGGYPDPWALHSGLEVEGTEPKWVASHFFRVPGVCSAETSSSMAARTSQLQQLRAQGDAEAMAEEQEPVSTPTGSHT
ncbi:hypothetical protein AB1Y20_018710 [Prymnesium parvum]|uniref:Fe2OG dioxygenase domain-containing protein n=1 Tax=Prymnesium parvum TaxID=97485 RepID=A0AB34JSJ4_PRYPA